MNLVVLEAGKHLGIVLALAGRVLQQLLPPWEKELVHDKLEPRRERRGCVSLTKRTVQVVHQLLQLVHRNPFHIANLVLVDLQRDWRSQEQDIVD